MDTKMLDVICTANRLQALFEVADEALFPLRPTEKDCDRIESVFFIMMREVEELVKKLDELDELAQEERGAAGC